ncbi:MAG: hypothetical protein AAF690_06030 [Acidobacteriota bacterium]
MHLFQVLLDRGPGPAFRAGHLARAARRTFDAGVAFLLLFCISQKVDGAKPETVSELAAAHRSLLEIVQGPPLMVSASPALCAAQGRPVLPGAEADAQRWLFGSGACTLFFPPDLGAAITRATTALEREAARPATASRIGAALERMRQALDSPSPALDRLLAQSFAWEIGIAALRGARDSRLACRALDVVEHSQLESESLAELPDTLERAAGASDATRARLGQLRSGDPLLLEVLPPSTSHAEALRGRFTARLFVTSLKEEEAAKMREELSKGVTNYDFLGQLPFRYDDVYALLLLYYNTLTADASGRLTPTPTPVLAFWQEYSFSGRADREPTLRQAEAKLTFRSIAIDAGPGNELEYREIPGTAVAHKSFVDAMPPTTGSPVTTKHGVCLRCHTRVIEAFHPQSRREVRFAPALTESARISLDHAFAGELQQELGRWQQVCRDE